MKKLVLTLALVFGVLAANAQYFVGGQLGLLYDDASENTMITIAPEFGYAFNDTWTVAGMIGYTHMDNFNSFYIAPYARWNFWKKDFVGLLVDVWGIERSGFFNGREKWAKGFENQRV